ncbi:MAG: hypothetical protein R2911_36830 [Caldilineaceae bacterium]
MRVHHFASQHEVFADGQFVAVHQAPNGAEQVVGQGSGFFIDFDLKILIILFLKSAPNSTLPIMTPMARIIMALILAYTRTFGGAALGSNFMPRQNWCGAITGKALWLAV